MPRSSRCHSFGAWRQVIAVGALVLALAWLYRRLLVGRVLAGGDLQSYFFPYWCAAARAVQRGQLPLWNPHLFAGAPLLANSQAGVFYPLNWLFWALSGTGLPALTRSLHLSVLLHLALAALTLWWLARRLGVGPWGAALGGLLYAGGGFLGVHVEHLNQLQGLAWLPLAFLPPHSSEATPLPSPLSVLALTMILLTGHTQTAFIAAVGLVVFYVTLYVSRFTFHTARLLLSLLPFTFAGVIAAAQLLPTFELAQHSLRAGGLPWREAVSFSLVPWTAHRTFLPAYLVAPVLPEAVAYVGVLGLLLAGWGAWRAWRTRRERPVLFALLAVGGVGLFLAVGGYNPLYLLAARLGLPGVVQFRAPARYLALTTLALALLGGAGLSLLFSRIAQQVSHFTPHVSLVSGSLAFIVVALVFAELAFAAEALPHADATAARAYSDLRPATAHLVAGARADQSEGRPPGRFLSISKLLFDPGDTGEIETLYAPVLSPDALWHYFVAAKAREVLSPNLPLAFAVPAVDGYDGGLLPLRHYAAFSRLLLPGGTVDGRLRENLTALPEERWLSLLDVRYLITDKTADTWVDGVFYDRRFQPVLTEGATLAPAWLPEEFAADALHLFYTGAGKMTVTLQDGSVVERALTEGDGAAPAALTWRTAQPVTDLVFHGGAEGLTLSGATLVDARTGAFFPLVLSGRFRLVHSGDVKLYENLASQPRAFLVTRARCAVDDDAALAAMTAPDFDPRTEAILSDCAGFSPVDLGPAAPAASVEVVDYAPQRVVVEVRGAPRSALVLADAWYPGWSVEIEPLSGGGALLLEPHLLRADLLFRAVPLIPGDWRVTFRYDSPLVVIGGILSGVGVLGWLGYAWILYRQEGMMWRAERET